MLRLNFPAQLQLQFLASASACGAGQHFWASPESCLWTFVSAAVAAFGFGFVFRISLVLLVWCPFYGCDAGNGSSSGSLMSFVVPWICSPASIAILEWYLTLSAWVHVAVFAADNTARRQDTKNGEEEGGGGKEGQQGHADRRRHLHFGFGCVFSFFLYFFLSFVLSSCHFFHVCVSAYNVSPSFCFRCRHLFCLSAASRLSLVMFSYIFVHCLPLIWLLAVAAPPFSLSFSLSVPAMCCLLTFNEMSTKDQALCDFSLPLSLLLCFPHCLPRLVANWALDCLPMSATESQFVAGIRLGIPSASFSVWLNALKLPTQRHQC